MALQPRPRLRLDRRSSRRAPPATPSCRSVIPNKPFLDGVVTVWFQFGAANDDFATWGGGPRASRSPKSITIDG
jgi:hypothetical protein